MALLRGRSRDTPTSRDKLRYLLYCFHQFFFTLSCVHVSFCYRLYLNKMLFFYSFRKRNIFDNMVQMMEKYADNLEELVAEKTVQLMDEKRKTDALLESILPR